MEQREEFLRGFVYEIGIDPDAGSGVITFYELPASSLMMVPGAGDDLLRTLRFDQLDGFRLPGRRGGRLPDQVNTTSRPQGCRVTGECGLDVTTRPPAGKAPSWPV